jgi:hypothetical protein
MAQGKVAFGIDDVFDAKRFAADIEAYRVRHNITVADLSRITGISSSTVSNLRVRGIVSIQSAVIFAYLIDVRLDDYIHTDNLEEMMMSKFTVMPTETPAEQDGRYNLTKKARAAATKRLVAMYQESFEKLLDEERERLGLPPRVVTVFVDDEPSATEWVPEPELTINDRVEWAYPGERRLAEATNEAIVEVVCRSVKESVPEHA